MKTISKILLVAAAFGTMALVSCRKEENTPTVEDATFEAPALADAAVKVEFNTTTESQQVVVPSDDPNATIVVKDIEFTEGGYAIITKSVVAVKATVGEEIVEIKAYVYNETTGEYEIAGFGTVKINAQTKTVEVTLKNAAGGTEETKTVTATSVADTPAPQEGTMEGNLCRKWAVNRVVVSVKGGQLGKDGVGVKIDNPNNGIFELTEIDKLLKENNVNVPDINLTDYGIKDINFTQNGTFLINFKKEGLSFTGPYTLGGKKFQYELKGEGNYIFNAKAEGSVDFQKVNNVDYCFFNVNGVIENGNDKYTSTVELTLVEKK